MKNQTDQIQEKDKPVSVRFHTWQNLMQLKIKWGKRGLGDVVEKLINNSGELNVIETKVSTKKK